MQWRTRLAAVSLGAALFGVSAVSEAFCGFYVSGSSEQLVNRATRVSLMRRGTRTVLSMSNDYEGPPQDFAMVVPVPVVLQQENVRTLPHDVFNRLEQLTAPRLVEYWEQDPCPPPRPPMEVYARTAALPMAPPVQAPTAGPGSYGVRIEARFAVGEYQVLVLSAEQSDGLERWLVDNHYNIPRGASDALAPYVREQWKFFVARIDLQRVERRPNGGARLSPLRFHYDSTEFRLPVRLGLLAAPPGAPQDLLVYVLSDTSRYEVANYRNVFIPTNLDVTEDVRVRFGEFYTRLFDETLSRAGGRAVVTEYAWQSSSCDPCPVPPMEGGDLATLGGDALAGAVDVQGNPAAPPPNPWQASMVVTRLHTRYNRATLTEDLVFREAQSVVGGREFVRGANGRLEEGAVVEANGQNNFQARYAIRHPWTGEISCRNPVRGVWGGPPHGASPPPAAATDLANVQRSGQLNLASLVYTNIPELGVVAGQRLQLITPKKDDRWLLYTVGVCLTLLTAGFLWRVRKY